MDPERPGELAPSGVFFDTGEAAGSVRPEPCALCGAGPVSLQKYTYVMSFLIFTQHKRYDLLLCRPCSTRQGLKELSKSALLGWWGIPWGVMTFWALWVNTRTLFRWSTLAPVAALMLGLAGLIPPAALGAWLYHREVVEDAAIATGDWGDAATIELLNEGQRKSQEGDLGAALESYRAAYVQAPNSSFVNFAIARVLHLQGRDREALPFAARAETINPRNSSCTALHGVILFLTGDEQSARNRARDLRGREPENVVEATWVVKFFETIHEYEEMLGEAEKGLALFPDDQDLQVERIDALLWLDRLKEAEKFLAELDAETQSWSYVRFMKVIPHVKSNSMAGLEELLVLWKEDIINDRQMERFIGLARSSTNMEAMRARVILWLHDKTTPSNAWFLARPWFDASDWVPQLDMYLAGRRETIPAMLRIGEMDIATQNRQILTLADSVRALPHPWAQGAEEAYFDALNRDVPADRFLEELRHHLDENPSHAGCRLRLCRFLIEALFEQASGCLAELEKLEETDPELGVPLKILRAEQQFVDGKAAEALEDLERLPPDAISGGARFYIAEAAFHAGRLHTLHKTLKEIGGEKDPSSEAPALLLRWSGEIIQGMLPTYDLDVGLYVKQYGDAIRKSESASAHAILVAEGLEEPSMARKIIGDRASETYELVAAIKQAAAQGKIDLAVFERLASSEHRGSYGTRLARTIVERSRLAGKTSS